ncbi:MAG: hypothetical protein KBF58_05745 [Methyloversatilis sp.]|jgi:hypothetical protein|nr:hypothetical protein [Methyloversatilis sp.]MBP6193781.1 hypothetical protein [Methyloversatilis sp.]MBP9117564.1 hypothetical protein [Methyloversatilis sp.]
MEMIYSDFVGSQTDPLTWYDLLPGDPVRISGMPDNRPGGELADALLAADSPDDPALLDLLTARLLNDTDDLSRYPHWRELATRLSRLMCSQLAAGGSRPLRMRAQRLNYCIQSLLDRGRPADFTVSDLCEVTLPGSKPWDCVAHQGARWWLTSDELNVHREDASGAVSWRRGLPTQLDPLPDGRLSVGSIYTPGAHLVDGLKWTEIAHDQPVPLVFEHDGGLYFLDHSGVIWRDRPRAVLWRTPCSQVHFARLIDGVIHCLDNADFGHITCCDIASGAIARHATDPVQVCNDVTLAGGHIYMIDKQQGSVFKFDRDFRFIGRALRFGRGPGELLDPVGLRFQGERLRVVSWLSGRLTELRPF